jgi:hypothetical protein
MDWAPRRVFEGWDAVFHGVLRELHFFHHPLRERHVSLT